MPSRPILIGHNHHKEGERSPVQIAKMRGVNLQDLVNQNLSMGRPNQLIGGQLFPDHIGKIFSIGSRNRLSIHVFQIHKENDQPVAKRVKTIRVNPHSYKFF
jgi:hypothetical protein